MIYYIILAVISTVSIATYLYIEKISRSFKNTYLTKRLSGFDVVKHILDKNNLDLPTLEEAVEHEVQHLCIFLLSIAKTCVWFGKHFSNVNWTVQNTESINNYKNV